MEEVLGLELMHCEQFRAVLQFTDSRFPRNLRVTGFASVLVCIVDIDPRPDAMTARWLTVEDSGRLHAGPALAIGYSTDDAGAPSLTPSGHGLHAIGALCALPRW